MGEDAYEGFATGIAMVEVGECFFSEIAGNGCGNKVLRGMFMFECLDFLFRGF